MSKEDASETAVALFSFEGDGEEYELSFQEGDTIQLLAATEGIPDG